MVSWNEWRRAGMHDRKCCRGVSVAFSTGNERTEWTSPVYSGRPSRAVCGARTGEVALQSRWLGPVVAIVRVSNRSFHLRSAKSLRAKGRPQSRIEVDALNTD